MSLLKEKPRTEREKVERRREEVLAQGRKFKYPMQYAKHKLVINTVLVAIVAIILMIVAGWAMLYKLQDTGDMLYRVTQVIPVPVAKVAGESVRYSDYLMIYRSNLLTTEQQGGQLGDEEGDEVVRERCKEAALKSALEYTYALKLGREKGITVSDEEIDKAFDDHRRVGGVERSEGSFLKIVRDNFGMNRMEYRRMLYLTLMKAKVTQAVDDDARAMAQRVEELLVEKGGNFLEVVGALEDTTGMVEYQETGQLVDNLNVDGGRSEVAAKLEVGQISDRFLSTNGDGYYYVKLVEKTDTQVSHVSIKIRFAKFSEMMEELYANGEVEEYIKVGLDEIMPQGEVDGAK